MTGRDGKSTIGEALRAARRNKGLSLDEVARRVGVSSRRTVIRWEADENVPEGANRAALARELSLPDDFFADARAGEERLSHRVEALEEAVARIERQLFGKGAVRAR